MINIVSTVLTLYTWVAVCVVLYFLFAIARFYQEKSGRRSFYAIFFIPIAMFALAGLRYAWLAPIIIGDFWGDLMRIVAGVTLVVAGYFLLNLMTGKR